MGGGGMCVVDITQSYVHGTCVMTYLYVDSMCVEDSFP